MGEFKHQNSPGGGLNSQEEVLIFPTDPSGSRKATGDGFGAAGAAELTSPFVFVHKAIFELVVAQQIVDFLDKQRRFK